MAHVSAVGAGIYSALSLAVGAGTNQAIPATPSGANFHALFDTQVERTEFGNVREFPAMGTPANIVKVPGFGAKQSRQIQGQADAPTMDLTINYVPLDWSDSSTTGALGTALASDLLYLFRFALMNGPIASAATGLATDNSCYYWLGRVEACLVKPSLTDATTATVSLSMSSDFYGAFTH
jgi:hypothetical protein